jgi:16S rRNA (guanine966-N2)-methyltransferase
VPRIVAGQFGGRRLVTPAGRDTRPTSERVREALFAALDADGALHGARVLDLFAGTGALGLEAVSRGADSAVLVDDDRRAVAACRANVAALDVVGQVSVRQSAAVPFARRAARLGDAFDLVLADPPYDLDDDDLTALLAALAAVVAPGGLVVVERGSRTVAPHWPSQLRALRKREYGETVLWWAAG